MKRLLIPILCLALTTSAIGQSSIRLDNTTYAPIWPTAPQVRGAFGLVIGTNVQAFDADLTTWAGITPSANGQSLVAAANYPAMLALLGATTGGAALLGVTSPLATSYLQIEADGDINKRTFAEVLSDIGAARLAGGNTFTGPQVFPSGQALISPTANTLALGGATLGSNALAVTGSGAVSSTLGFLGALGSFSLQGSSPVNTILRVQGSTTGACSGGFFYDGPDTANSAYFAFGAVTSGTFFGTTGKTLIASSKNGSGTLLPFSIGSYNSGWTDWLTISTAGAVAIPGTLAVAGKITQGTGLVTWSSGAGSPESVVTAPIGSMYSRTDGGANTTLYVKESGAGNTGWIAK